MATFQPAILSASLGRAWLHDLDIKVKEAGQQGFKGIEISYEDLEYVAKKLSNGKKPNFEDLIEAAQRPFLFYEGLLDRQKHDALIEKIHVWFRIVKEMETVTIQIPANFLPADQLTGDMDVIVSDLRELADLGLKEQPEVRFATHIDTWEKAWEVVKRVDRSNFGLCLDTFNIAGRVWADPTSPDGKKPNADEDLKKSIHQMVQQVDLNKVFYIQTIIHDMKYKGFISMELFSRTMSEQGELVPAEHARRGMESWAKLRCIIKAPLSMLAFDPSIKSEYRTRPNHALYT
ncbi:xylose isomerase-like protein [Phaeosphaeriaceae sp. PMI808]|nr:xylose isomerase-like protein [Phaeosphaeriaceae sp. PMI808]